MKADFHTYLLVLSCSFVLFLFFFRILSWIISRRYVGYQKLSNFKQIEWDDRNNSTIHALISAALSSYVLLTDVEGNIEPLWGASWITEAVCVTSMGYALSDLIFFVYTYPSNTGGYWGTIVHHICMFVQYAISVKFSVYCYLCCFRTLSEFSTPFINLRWMLAELKQEGSTIYVINGCSMTLAFFMCRILTMPYTYVRIFGAWNSEEYNRLGLLQLCLLSGMAVDVLNILWFRKIMRGFLKYAFSTPKKKSA